LQIEGPTLHILIKANQIKINQHILNPGGFINLKTESPDLYRFTKTVAELYDITIVEDSENVYSEPIVKEELKIKTHYESLDIAQSKKIHYMKFTLPLQIKDIDEALQQLIQKNEQLD